MHDINKRTLALGSAGIVAAAGLTIAGAPAADAGTSAPTKYVCTTTTNLQIPVTVVGRAKLPAQVRRTRSLAGIPVTMRVTIDDATIHGIQNLLKFTWFKGTVTKGAFTLRRAGGGTGTIPIGKLTIPQTTVPPAGQDLVLTARGKTARTAHAPKRTGRYTVRMPKGFVFTPVSDAAVQTGPMTCASVGARGSLGTMRVVR